MNLTPSAVSHAVRKLETLTGVRLFLRNGRKVRLTAEGEALLERVQTGLESIREGIGLISTHQPQLLRLHCAPSFAAQWLTPRLASLFRAYPTLDVRLAANLRYADFPAAEFDADITYGQHASADCYSIPLGHETVTPMCARHLAHRLQRPEDVLSERLIHSDNKRIRWVDWFRQNRITAPDTAGSRFDRSFIAIAAAVDGLGVCLESTRLAERELREGDWFAPSSTNQNRWTIGRITSSFPSQARTRPASNCFGIGSSASSNCRHLKKAALGCSAGRMVSGPIVMQTMWLLEAGEPPEVAGAASKAVRTSPSMISGETNRLVQRADGASPDGLLRFLQSSAQ